MADQTDFTLQQALAAQRSLRETIGLAEERFPVPAFVGMVGDEIDAMREAGHSDRDIVAVVEKATGIALAPEDIARFHVPSGQRHPHGR